MGIHCIIVLRHGAARARATLLGSSALSTAALAMLLAGPQAALAACTVTSNPNSVTCAADTTTTNTTNTDAATANSSNRTQTFTANGNVTGTVNNNVTVGGVGLAVQTSQAGSTLSFTNNGMVTGTDPNLPALHLIGNGGLVTYSGSGSVNTTSTNDVALLAQTSGNGAIAVTTNGSITGGTGIRTQATTGTTTITVNGGTVSGNDDGTGIGAGANGGTTTVTLNGGTVSSGNVGITATDSGSGSVVVNANAGSLVSSQQAIIARSGAGNVTVSAAGTAISSTNHAGIIASTTGGGNVSVNVTGGSVAARLAAIVATGSGAGTIDVTVGAGVTVASSITNGLNMTGGTGTATATVLGTLSGGANAADFRGTLNVGNGGTSGTLVGGVNMQDSATLLRFNRSDAFGFGGAISGGGALEKLGAGTLTLSGANTYTGATTVNAGALVVNGSIAASSSLTMNSGTTLGGTGTVGATTIASGGALAPGNSIGTLAVQGNLTFNAGSSYTVEVSPTAADRTNVTGTATLTGATVQAIALAGSFRGQTYTIVNATGGFGGTQFASLNVTGSSIAPGARNPHLTYDLNNVYLVLDPGTIQIPAGIGGNQSNAATAINNFVLNGGAPPAGFDTLLNMTGAPLENALGQVSGQPGASTTQTGFAATGQFVNGVFDGAFGEGAGQSGGLGFAESEDNAYAPKRKLSRDAKHAYAAVTPRDRRAPSFEARWNVWASVYGGNSRVNGDSTAGTNTTTSRIFGAVAGASYRFTADTQAGFALGGAGSSFDVDGGFGGGKADIFNAAIYAKHNFGAAYVAGLLGYSWQNTSTDRTVTIAGTDILHASFKAQALAARLEGGWRYATPAIGITPYAALQTMSFFLPSYGETATSGSSTFALNYAAKAVTATRSELGAKFDKAMLVQGGVFTLKAKTAWAHDWNTDRSAIATFQALPGATFTVNGAQPSANAALASLGAEMKWHNGWTLAASIDGEFSRTTAGYAGKGSVKYAW